MMLGLNDSIAVPNLFAVDSEPAFKRRLTRTVPSGSENLSGDAHLGGRERLDEALE